jgi:lysophospholipase L1-like esterase
MDRRWLLGGLLFAGGVGAVRAITARPKLNAESSVLLIGDSMGVGMAPHFKGLAHEEGLPFETVALTGTRVDQWVNSNRLLQKLNLIRPSHVLISLGTNDAYSGKTPENIHENTKELVEIIKEFNANPIWIGAPSLPERTGGVDLHVDNLLAIRSGTPYYFDSSTLTIPRGPDDLHPTAAGYAGWAGAIWNWLT